MFNYRSLNYVPPLVRRALNLAEQLNNDHYCSPETGRLLQLMSGQLLSGVIGEIGTGCGVAAAWIVSSLSPGTSFFTVDEVGPHAAAARALFDPLLNVRAIQGDWRDLTRNWRFAMLYVSQYSDRESEPELLLQSLRTGGLIILDGLTPREHIPLEDRDNPDPIRDFWLNDSRVLATEILVSLSEAVILATRTE